MADANKPVRLSKAAREFNLGIGTIVDFLDTKGINVDANPNTKLTRMFMRLYAEISKEIKRIRKRHRGLQSQLRNVKTLRLLAQENVQQ